MGTFLVILVNIRLAWNKIQRRNTLAYFVPPSARKRLRFIGLRWRGNGKSKLGNENFNISSSFRGGGMRHLPEWDSPEFLVGIRMMGPAHRDITRLKMRSKMFPHLKLLCLLFMGLTHGFDAKQRNSFLIKFGVFLQ